MLASAPYQEEALKRAVALNWLGQKVQVIGPEDLILHKLIAGRALDYYDASETLKEQKGKLNRPYLNRWIKKLKLAAKFKKLTD